MVRSSAWIVAALAVAGGAVADPGPTRLLMQPAIGPKAIAFVYADDLWVAELDGSYPRRLTSDIGSESSPVFSPDGTLIAFSAQYDGNTDVYTIPTSGGSPTRLTTHPGTDTVRGFTPDGKSVLFSSARNVYSSRHQQLFTVPLSGGMPTQLPIPWGFEASYSPDGAYIAYTPVRDATAQWKNYRGGTHSRLWIYNTKTHDVVEVPQPASRCNDLDPNWVGNAVYFRSDRAGESNLFRYDPDTKAVEQITRYTDFPIIDINNGGGRLIFEQAGLLHIYKPGETKPTDLAIRVATDAPEARPRLAKGSKWVRDAGVSPSGSRVAIEFRGEIVTIPVDKGDPRVLTNTPGAHERGPSWSPDGKTIAYFSDLGGEYHLVLAPQTGKGKAREVKLTGSGYYSGLSWSRDSKKLLYKDNSDSLYWLDVESGKSTRIHKAEYGLAVVGGVSAWSPDSKWVCYSSETPAQIGQAHVYSLEQNKSFPVTDGRSEIGAPAFDAGGKYLYFLGSNDIGMGKHGFSQSASDSRPPRWSLYLAILKKDLPSPFLRESDEEKSGEPTVTPPTPAPAPPTPPRKAELDDDKKKEEPKKDEPKKDEPKKSDADKEEPKKDAPNAGPVVVRRPSTPFSIDLDGLDQRILAIPVPAGNYAGLQTGAPNQVYMLARSSSGEGERGSPPAGGLVRYDVEKRRLEPVQSSATAYELTPDGRKLLYRNGSGDWFVTSSGGGGASALAGLLSARPGSSPTSSTPSTGGSEGKLNLDAIEVRVVPRDEWKQILREAWRINRDFFYDPTMHGADWNAVYTKYEPFLAHATHSGDVYRVVRWMLSELAVGHSYMTPGERVVSRRSLPGGLLGADYEVANGRYRFKKIYSGLNFTSDQRSPLTAPGVNVKEGEYLLAVNGVELTSNEELYSRFENTAKTLTTPGRSVELTVGPNPEMKGSRTVTVEPIESELALRNREWVEANLRKVEKATNGRVGYVYLPDTAGPGMTYFKRYFFPQVDKEALIIDERFNGGGQIADYYIDILRRPFASFWAPRHGAEWRSPSAAVFGPKVMLADEGAGSGGDMLPYMFKKFGLGPVVGKRTWGGLVGISGYPVLMDGGTVTAPSFAIWTPEEGFIIENEGVPPDYDVEMWPKDVIAGRDPQLEKAIELSLKALEKSPKPEVKRPPYPKRAVR